jgi:hypothetical protein
MVPPDAVVAAAVAAVVAAVVAAGAVGAWVVAAGVEQADNTIAINTKMLTTLKERIGFSSKLIIDCHDNLRTLKLL